ncbi:MSMEG_1061 family FMN-dependent PPOX-type flavoprotein [Nocardioides convexus]|uniref:MSMEG_1061 family FMN-dependent PPOX-type flavoprotein n=1 Tax=Nocardioides convexus TaxID=2712224 RepID=UPI0031017548
MSPTILLRGGKPVLALGSPGGSTIITTVLQVLRNRLDGGMSLPAAVAAPRASQRNTAAVTAEQSFIDRYGAALAAYGHTFSPAGAPGTSAAEIGAVEAIEPGAGRAAHGSGGAHAPRGRRGRGGAAYPGQVTWTEIADEETLTALLGEPTAAASGKERAALTDVDRDWLAASPFCFLGTADADGRCDVSPKGDPAGHLVHVVDEHTVAIAERPGNRRADGYRNILANPHVGLNFLIPGRGDTLRINGRARLVSEAPFFDAMVVKGHRPILAVVVEIETIFFHCAKAFLRSQPVAAGDLGPRRQRPAPGGAGPPARAAGDPGRGAWTPTTARPTPSTSTAEPRGRPAAPDRGRRRW